MPPINRLFGHLCSLAVFLSHIGLSTASPNSDDQAGALLDVGTFQNPSAIVRPRFRYWANDGSLDPKVVAEDVRSAGKMGAGGIELLGYYLYGDSQNFNGELASPLQADWTSVGFGSPAWSKSVHLSIFLNRVHLLIFL